MSVLNSQVSATPDPQTQARAWQRVEQVILDNFHEPEIQAAKVLFACLAAHRITNHPPAWLLLIAPPGSMKTVLLESLQGLPNTLLVDEVTPNTFISGKLDEPGKSRRASPSLLHRIGSDGVLINADFSTTLSMEPHKRAAVLSQLRRIYDGCYSRQFGTDENLQEREWRGRLTFLAGVTPEVNQYHSVFQSLGERFLRVRWERAGGDDAALCAMQQTDEVKEQLCASVHELLLPVFRQSAVWAPELSYSSQVYLAKLGEETVKARAFIKRDSRTREILDAPQIESNTRLPQQLAQVSRGWAVLMGRCSVELSDLDLAQRSANDSIPPIRLAILRAHEAGVNPYTLGLPPSAVKYAIQDLQSVGLLPSSQPSVNGYTP